MNEPTQPSQETRYEVELTVHPDDRGGCSLKPDRERHFKVRNEDEVHMVDVLQPGHEMRLFLKLKDGTQIEGVSFGRTSEAAREAEQKKDTGGDYYGDTPFEVAPHPGGGTVLTVRRETSGNRFEGRLWYFDLWTADTRASGRRIDPKIYNKGDGLEPPGR